MQSTSQLAAGRKTRALPSTVLDYEATESESSQSSSNYGEVTKEVLKNIIATLDNITPKSSQQCEDIFSSQESFSYSQEVEKIVPAQSLADYLVSNLPVDLLCSICNIHALSMDARISASQAKDKFNLPFDVANCMYKNHPLIRDLVEAALDVLKKQESAEPGGTPKADKPSASSSLSPKSQRPSPTAMHSPGVNRPAKKVRFQIDDSARSRAP
jgi:hypothetical protein